MSEQYPGGFITKSPPTPAGPYQNSAAPGLWTLSQAAGYKKQGLWPTAGLVDGDPQFNYVTLLLHGDGTNGAQNNTFLDGSTNNFPITRNGSTTQGSFSPYGPNWSNYFDGTGDYLTVPDDSAWAFGSGNFTLEAWVYRTVSGATQIIVIQSDNASAAGSAWSFYILSTNKLRAYVYYGSSFIELTSSSDVPANAWVHVALVRTSGTVSQYINGSRDGTSASLGANSLNDVAQTVGIGATNAGNERLTGYLSNIRIIKGAGPYDATLSTLTVPTAPLTAISGTSLLTCQSNRFIDNSANNFAVTPNGDASVQRFNPFGTSTAYSTSVFGGSGFFPSGSSQGSSSVRPLAVPNNSAFNLTGDFTVELWHYGAYPATGANNVVFLGSDYDASVNNQIGLNGDATRMAVYHPSTGTQVSSTVSGIVGSWNYYAYVRSGSTITFYFNGVNIGTVSNSQTFTMQNGAFGGLGGYGGAPAGYLTDFRVSNGTVRYTSNFTPPTAPLTALSGTTCLLSMTNGAIFDNAMINDLGTFGSTQISTSVKKFGTGSVSFNGSSNNYLQAQSALLRSSGPFTFECWAYWNNTGTSSNMGMLCSQYASGSSGRMLFGSQSGALVLRVDGGTVYLTTSVSTGIWYFVAWTFDGTTHRLFLDGVLVSSSTSVPALYTGVSTSFGGQSDTLLADYCLNGYMDEIRTSNFCRYTATFTPPTAAFLNTGPN